MGHEFQLRSLHLFLAFSLLNEKLYLEVSAFSFDVICQMANGGIKGHSRPKQCFGG